MKALYRKYRPKSLDEVVGQGQVTTALKNALSEGKISHAYLFFGPRGTGKTSVARILAHEVNGFKYELEDDHVDIIEIDGASNRGVDNIRELREKVVIAPARGKYKIYIIDEVHMLTKEAFNALLKTLEEPPAHAIFIMATTDAYKVPVTITSRAQTYTFRLADASTMLQHLKTIAKAEKINITDEALEIIARRGGGSFRDSLSLLDQISNLSADQKISKQQVIAAIGLPEDAKITALIEGYLEGDVVKITTLLQELLSTGIKAKTITEEMMRQIIANPKKELLALLEALTTVKAPFAEARLILALCGMVERPANVAAAATPTPTIAPTETPAATTSPISFDWSAFTEQVQNLSEAVHSQLIKTSYKIMDNELHLYPQRKIVKTILDKTQNKQILMTAAKGITKITIHEPEEKIENAKKDQTLAKISAIMGGEIGEIENGGGSPF